MKKITSPLLSLLGIAAIAFMSCGCAGKEGGVPTLVEVFSGRVSGQDVMSIREGVFDEGEWASVKVWCAGGYNATTNAVEIGRPTAITTIPVSDPNCFDPKPIGMKWYSEDGETEAEYECVPAIVGVDTNRFACRFKGTPEGGY